MSRTSATSTGKRVLCVSYLFPPTGGVGVLRTVKFVKFLPEFGWNVTVLTAENPSVPLIDESLLAEIPQHTVVHTARTGEPGYAVKRMVANSSEEPPGMTGRITGSAKWFARTAANALLQPDAGILWYPQAVREGLRILRQERIDAILTTAPPFSSLLVGATLARKTGIPLVLDYRDEWTISNAYWENKRQGGIANAAQRKMQQHVLRAAHTVVATTPGTAAAIRHLARDAGSGAVTTHIYNGFDPADFPTVNCPPERVDYGNGTRLLRIAFLGTLWTVTSIEPFVKALQILAERDRHLLESLEVVVAGRQVGDQLAHLDVLDALPCQFANLGFLEHNDAARLMTTADWLLQLQSDLPRVERVIASKLFEYMGARRPILAITGKGDHYDLLCQMPNATICSPNDPAGIANAIAMRLEAHRCGVSLEAGHGDVSRFERRNLTAQLAALLDGLGRCNVASSRAMENRAGLSANEATR